MGSKGKTARAVRAVEAQRRSGPTVAVAWIHPGQVSAYFADSLLMTVLWDMAQPQPMIRDLLREWSSANVSASRNTLTTQFLDRNAELVAAGLAPVDWLLWVDADMQWEPADLGRLVASADPVDRPIVGGLCFGLFEGKPAPTIWHGLDAEDGFKLVRLVETYPRDQMVRCLATGAAFVLIHRTVLEAVRDRAYNKAFPFFQETELDGDPVGEDLTFCLRAALLGYPMHVNTSVRVGHHKSDLITEASFDAARALLTPADQEAIPHV